VKLPVSVVGDDLTGVVAVGGELASRGLAAVLLRDTEHLRSGSLRFPTDVRGLRSKRAILITTESRHDEVATARAKVHSASTALLEQGTSVLIKKMDSLLRGNIAAEIAAAMEGFEATKALCVFAAPSQGRTTVEGCQLVNGVPVGQGDDPGSYLQSEAREANVVELLSQEFGSHVRHLNLEVIRRGPEAIRAALRSAMTDASARVIVCDATAVEHVDGCVRAAISSGVRILAGTSDLSGAVADALIAAGTLSPTPPVLVVSGTASRAGGEQVNHAVRRGVARLVEVPAFHLLAVTEMADVGAEEIARYARRVSDLLRSRTSVLLCPDKASPDDLAGRGVSHRVAEGLARIGAASLRGEEVGGVIATGGETARRMLDSMEARELMIGREVMPGIPEAVVLGGPHAGLRFIAKTGAYGGVEALETLAGWIRAGNEAFDASLSVTAGLHDVTSGALTSGKSGRDATSSSVGGSQDAGEER
jgi:uncharacterized protein YgbK (DUF1537 family)